MTQERDILNYRPDIKDTWESKNILGDYTLDAYSEKAYVVSEVDNTEAEKREEMIREASKMVLEENTAENTLEYINLTKSSINKLYNNILQFETSFPYTIGVLLHSYKLWESVQAYIAQSSFTAEDIRILDECRERYNKKTMEFTTASNALSLSGDNGTVDMIVQYDKLKSEYNAVKIEYDSKLSQCHMSSDINIAIKKFAMDATYTCDNLLDSVSDENKVVDENAPVLFSDFSSSELSDMEDIIGSYLYKELNTLKRIQDNSISIYSVAMHFANLSKTTKQKASFIPKAKHLFRSGKEDSDFTNSMIYDMFKQCKQIDDHFTELFVNTIKYLHAENTILLKTFFNESKLNRFRRSADALKNYE